MEKLKSSTIICQGGLDSNQNWLQLSLQNPGKATRLVNFEPSLYGGYRRIDGFSVLESTDSGEVDPTNAEGKIFGVAIYGTDEVIAARKLQSGATYNFYKYVSGSSWSGYTTGLTLSSASLDKIRNDTYNFDGTYGIIFADGVNNATLYNGTSWINIDPAASGADFANAGGPQALASPKDCVVWENHVFTANCSFGCNIIAHSAPNAEYDWTASSGAGQISAGMEVLRIYPFRDKLFVFGRDQIKYIYVTDSGTFGLKDFTSSIGCLAPDSILEVGGDLIFLSPDGIRPISATDRIGDFEIASISKKIQEDIKDLINSVDSNEIDGLVVRGKSQFRYFFSDTSLSEDKVYGVIGAIKSSGDGVDWEYGLTLGIKVSCAYSGYVNNTEYVLHGTHDGKVMRQESGSTFNGTDILSIYSTPYIDFGTPSIRKTLQSVKLFTKPEGTFTLTLSARYDWADPDVLGPSDRNMESGGFGGAYGSFVYGSGTYGGASDTILFTNITGSGKSYKLTISSTGGASYSMQGFVVVYEENGYR